jgi:hypothetical protein
MKILVQRDIFTTKSTASKVYVNDAFKCYGLEDVDRHLEDGGVKVFGETCIPRGTYPLIIDFSHRFDQLMPHVLEVPGFTGVRIHPGNTAKDTHGCLLVGLTRGEDQVLNSRSAYNTLFRIIEAEMERGGRVDIEFK